MKFVIPGKAQPKQRPRRGKRGRYYTPKATKNYEKKVANAAREAMQGISITDEDVEVEIFVYWPDKRRRDLDNTAKSILDGMNGVVYDDDYRVQTLIVRRFIDRDNPRAEVEVEFK